MHSAYSLFTAIGTPLHEDGETLHVEGLERHLEDQWRGGMTGLLVAGTMGLMPLLTDETFVDLVDHALAHSTGRGQIMVGAGDTSLPRTRARVELLNSRKIDGVVVLAPYFWKFNQRELIRHFTSLADFSKNPLYLYDLPGLTGTKIELETVLKLAEHPNIRGIKCSADAGWTRQLNDAAPPHFHVFFAQADLLDVLFRHGIRRHVDGIFSVAPAWTSAIARAADLGDWERASDYQRRLSGLLRVVKRYGVFQSVTALLNARGIPGRFAPAPLEMISEPARQALLAEPIVRELLATRPAHAPATAGSNGHRSNGGSARSRQSTNRKSAAGRPSGNSPQRLTKGKQP